MTNPAAVKDALDWASGKTMSEKSDYIEVYAMVLAARVRELEAQITTMNARNEDARVNSALEWADAPCIGHGCSDCQALVVLAAALRSTQAQLREKEAALAEALAALRGQDKGEK